MNYFYQFPSLTIIFRGGGGGGRGVKIENLQNVNVNKNLGKKMIKNMLPIKVCMFYEILETILRFGLHYLHLDLFQFLHRYLNFHVQFCLCVFQGKISIFTPPPPYFQNHLPYPYLKQPLVSLKISISSATSGLPNEIKRRFRYSTLLTTLQRFE